MGKKRKHNETKPLEAVTKAEETTPERPKRNMLNHIFSGTNISFWFRNYQIYLPHNDTDKVDRGGLDKMTLVEVGPRFCLNPIKIFGGSIGGPTLYENPFYIYPNHIRALEKRKKAGKYAKKVKAKTRRKNHKQLNLLEPDEFAGLWKEE